MHQTLRVVEEHRQYCTTNGKHGRHRDTFDVYRVTHRTGTWVEIRAIDTFDARRWCRVHKVWSHADMHARIVIVANTSDRQRHNMLALWLRNALPFNLWR